MNEKIHFDALIKEHSQDGELIYLGQLLQRAALKNPGRIALYCQQDSITFSDLYARSVALSRTLIEQGIKPGDRVLLYVYNSIEFYYAYYAILQIGAVAVPLNIFLKERELEHIISDANPSLIIASADFSERLAVVGKNKNLPRIMIAEELRQNKLPPKNEIDAFDPVVRDRNVMAVLLYTSGTTGLPKGVMISSNNSVINTIQGITRFNPQEDDRILAALPLFHSFAQNTYVWLPIFLSIAVVIVPRIERRYILQALELHKPTILAAVPAFYGLLCLFKTAPLESVRIFLCGGDALPDKIRAAFELLYRRKIVSGYGMTETSPFVSGSFDDEAIVYSCVGRPLVDIEYQIRGEEGRLLPQGEIGELWLKGPNVMLGYYNESQMTHNVLQNGWLSTGDLVYVDEKGRFVITGRYKDLIKNKGFNIYPQEVENVLLMHPNVIKAAVIGQPDEMQGEVAVAYVQLREKDDAIETALKDLCVKNLADYKVPKFFIGTTEELPTTATGKIDKKALRMKHEKN